jgi:predicted TIM-barrel fold metal-dependent hydrolase
MLKPGLDGPRDPRLSLDEVSTMATKGTFDPGGHRVTMTKQDSHMTQNSGRIISVDDHVIEPPHVWLDRVPRRDRDRAPRVVGQDGADWWVYEDARTPVPLTVVQAGYDRKEIAPRLMTYDEMRPEFYDPVARSADMDRDGVLASLCFPFFPRYCGQTFYEASDREFSLLCLRAYNDWMIDEWCGRAPGRFIPLIIIPLWDPQLAAIEIERCAGKGAKAIAFSENPAKLGLPSLHDKADYWDPVLSAANATSMPLCIHFGSSSMVPNTSDDSPRFVPALLSPLNLAYCAADWLFYRNLSRYPDLKVCLSEGGIGWIPYILERAEYIVRSMDWAFKLEASSGGMEPLDEPPTEIFRRHIYGCFIDDSFGTRNLESIGSDNVMMETDYPHGDGSFPDSVANAHRLLDGHSDEVKYKVMQGNAQRVFGLAPE